MTDNQPFKHPLAGLANQWGQKGNYQDNYEERVVKFILSHYKLSALKHELVNDHYKATGDRRLTLDRFVQTIGFPVYLCAAKLPYLTKDCTWHQIFMKPANRQLVRKYVELIEEIPSDCASMPFGVVYYWPYLSGGLIAHDTMFDVEYPGMRLIWTPNKKIGIDQLVIEPFKQFLGYLPWGPQSDDVDSD